VLSRQGDLCLSPIEMSIYRIRTGSSSTRTQNVDNYGYSVSYPLLPKINASANCLIYSRLIRISGRCGPFQQSLCKNLWISSWQVVKVAESRWSAAVCPINWHLNFRL
jgi:hypothetical protein